MYFRQKVDDDMNTHAWTTVLEKKVAMPCYVYQSCNRY